VVLLPPAQEIHMNPRLGEILLSGLSGQLRIEGGGCILSPLPGTAAGNATRLFRVHNVVNNYVIFQLSNATVSGFGNKELDGGAIYFYRSKGIINSVIFRDNVGLAGGAVCIDQCSSFQFLSTQFVGNTAASDGGGVHVGSQVSNVNFTSCDFTHNVVTGEKISSIGTAMFMGR
jgi:hypothetical protein